MMKKITLTLERHSTCSCVIHIGYNVLDRIGLLITNTAPAHHYVIICDSNVLPLCGEKLADILRKMKQRTDVITFPAGESSKNIDTAIALISRLIDLGVDRSSVLIALGGGVTGDMVSFIASIYMRSVPYVHVPTTLMAQVDSSIGGKTGIDLSFGKNLLGTFYQPRGTFIDLQLLETLPKSELINGMAEVVKYGIIDDIELFGILEKNIEGIQKRNKKLMETIVGKSCGIKKEIVEIDETDIGIRRILNFGHTIGHAIEAASSYTISHGNAVSAGMIGSARISEKSGYLSSAERKRIEKLIGALGLSGSIPDSLDIEDILSRLKNDKKKEGDSINFVLLKKLGVPFINGSVNEDLMKETIEGLQP
ncbi:MAG: 3-dehydroquinate synthase [Deltaproteobacteria bacterium]|nr:3-dehydroquinate synthase [Deltaproteobacteria bacterium]MBN2845446.1 3-dehydroquinate synthase [Deltaproteobacteria bacterium]